jgi:SAM-dependent methyltransferase
MGQDSFQLISGAAAIYEEQKVPAIFGPLAEATLDRIPLGEGEDVLDVACGTGILARRARERYDNLGQVVGADLNPGMIETAQSLTDQYSKACDWHVADALNMPFDDNSFSVIFCQQGLQLFPDEDAALAEMKRLLRPGGKIAVSVWSKPPPLFIALADALKRHISETVGNQSLAPFGYKGRETMLAKMAALGFSGMDRQEFAVDRVIRDPLNAIPKEIASNPVGPTVAKSGQATISKITEEVLEEVSLYLKGDNIILPQHTHLFVASV